MLLPQLERLDIYRTYEAGTVVSGSAPAIKVFACPTSPSDTAGSGNIAYVANAGAAIPVSSLQVKGDGVMLDGFGNPPAYGAARISLDALTSGDGATNTLLFTEKNGSRMPQATWAVFPGAIGGATALPNDSGWQAVPVFGISAAPSATGKVINEGLFFAPASSHPGGVVATFADGHTRFLNDSIRPWVYAQLVTSDSKWAVAGGYTTNSPLVSGTAWLMAAGAPQPYNLSEDDF